MQKYVKNRMLWGYDLNLLAVVGISTLVLVLRRYHPLNIDFPQATALIYYLLVPLAAGLLLFRHKPWQYGIRIGCWRSSIVLTAVCLAAMAPILYEASTMPEFRSYYRMDAVDWSDLLLNTALLMFAWEFLFRGYMLFGLEESIGKSAIFVQTIPFCAASSRETFLRDAVMHSRRLCSWLRGIQKQIGSARLHHTLGDVPNDDLFRQLLGRPASSDALAKAGSRAAHWRDTGRGGHL